ncbi:MAG: MATE family efflux transporter [Prevotella sp.]|nr:MATE family efflux transporter [Prevotella sp.]
MNAQNRQILNIAIPSIISNITVPLIGLVDITISGHLGNVAYIGAIAVGTMIFNVIYWIFGFLRMGTSGMTSQALGSRDFAEVMRLLVRSLTVAMMVAAGFLLFQIPLRDIALYLMHPSQQTSAFAATYFSICIWGAPAMLCQYGLTGWFIGMQNTRVPMMVAILQNIINVVASLFFVAVIGMKIEGVALGTLIAQWCGLIIAVMAWFKFYRRLNRYSWRRNVFSAEAMRRFFVVNRDIFLRTLFLVAVNLFFLSAGARQGDIILSVNTLLMTLFTLFSYFMDGFAYAAEALSGKYYGAKNIRAFRDMKRRIAYWGIGVVIMFTLTYIISGRSFLTLLTDQSNVVASAMAFLPWAYVIPSAGVAAFIYDGIFIGITQTKGMLISSAISAIVFFALFFALYSSLGNHALWLAFNVYLAMRGFIQFLILRRTV